VVRDERPQVVLGDVVGVAAQDLQALPGHHPVLSCHVRQRGGPVPADLDAVVVQRACHPAQHHPRVRVRQRQRDHRHADHVLVAVERRVDVFRPVAAHHRGEVPPVAALAAHRPVQQEPLPAVGTFPGAGEVGGQVPPDRRRVAARGRGQQPAQRQHVPGFAGLRQLAQHPGRAAQVVPRPRRQRRHVADRHPAVHTAPADLGRGQRGTQAGVLQRDHVRPAAPRARERGCSRERG
jgi:hypothetical protein